MSAENPSIKNVSIDEEQLYKISELFGMYIGDVPENDSAKDHSETVVFANISESNLATCIEFFRTMASDNLLTCFDTIIAPRYQFSPNEFQLTLFRALEATFQNKSVFMSFLNSLKSEELYIDMMVLFLFNEESFDNSMPTPGAESLKELNVQKREKIMALLCGKSTSNESTNFEEEDLSTVEEEDLSTRPFTLNELCLEGETTSSKPNPILVDDVSVRNEIIMRFANKITSPLLLAHFLISESLEDEEEIKKEVLIKYISRISDPAIWAELRRIVDISEEVLKRAIIRMENVKMLNYFADLYADDEIMRAIIDMKRLPNFDTLRSIPVKAVLEFQELMRELEKGT